MAIEIHVALYLREWSGFQPVMLLENSCCYVCQGAIPSPQLDSHFLPAFTVPCWIHVYNVAAMVTWQNSKVTDRSRQPISCQLLRTQRQIV